MTRRKKTKPTAKPALAPARRWRDLVINIIGSTVLRWALDQIGRS